jgi:site-specific DNA recombinase
MIAAIYARKSTTQDVADEAKSVTRQIEHGRAFATRNGWQTDEALVFVDDGISGAEFTNRPGYLRLMNALKPKPRFQVLVMSEVSRLGRETIETAWALKQLSVAGVRTFSYLDDRELLVTSATDKFLLGAITFGAELEREKARQRATDTSMRKALAGHVTGGRVFGYTNVAVLRADGKRSHVERCINEDEAAVVRRIFQLSAAGVGQSRIAKLLNSERATAPRAQQGRPKSWAPSSVHEVLFRELYRGVILWNRTRKRNDWGAHAQTARPVGEWIRIDAPALRIVSDDDWLATHRRLDVAGAQYERATGGQRRYRRDQDSKYLLPGFGRCDECGGPPRPQPHERHTARVFLRLHVALQPGSGGVLTRREVADGRTRPRGARHHHRDVGVGPRGRGDRRGAEAVRCSEACGPAAPTAARPRRR